MHGVAKTMLFPFQFFQPEASRDQRGRTRRISRQKFPKRTRILSIPSKPHSFHSVHSAIGSRMNGMIFRSFRKRNSPQKNTNTVYSEYSCSGIVPEERALSFKASYNPAQGSTRKAREKRRGKTHPRRSRIERVLLILLKQCQVNPENF